MRPSGYLIHRAIRGRLSPVVKSRGATTTKTEWAAYGGWRRVETRIVAIIVLVVTMVEEVAIKNEEFPRCLVKNHQNSGRRRVISAANYPSSACRVKN